jgi:hypothetical protein
MKTLTWDSGYRWGDPNIRWGDPSYILEPGDPGYVPQPNDVPVQTQKRRRSTMPKSNYISQNDALFAGQMQTFKTNIGGYATLLGVSPAQMAAQAADADYFAYVVAGQETMQNEAQQWTAWRDLIRGGGTAPASGAPVAPVLPASVPAVAPGVEVRFRALVKQLKANANYNVGIGEALGIEGAVQSGPDLTTIQPQFEVSLVGGQVLVGWGWQGQGHFLDSCELQVDRGQGFGLLAQDTTPGYTDTQPLPAAPTKWTYRAIYRVGDNRVGQWSNPVSIMVG